LDKEKIREQARLRRRDLAKTMGLGFGTKMVEQFLANFEVQTGDKVAGYWPITNEVDVKPLLKVLHDNGCICLLPVVIARDTALLFRQWQPGDELIPSDLGISEPRTDKASGQPDILLVPLLAFDSQGNRLGYGGGYYDMTLSEFRGERDITAIGIAYSGQEVDSIPNESFDQRLDWVITENGATQYNADR
jgi:5-formyltetrahydrofolate cyclo-ligase